MRCTATLAGLLIAVSSCARPDAAVVSQIPEPIAEEVAWANKVCGLTIDTAQVVRAKPELAGLDDTAASNRISEWLGLSIQVAEKAMKDLDALKTGPNAKAENVATDVISAFERFKSVLEESKKAVGEANPTDASSTTAAFTRAADVEAPADELYRVVRLSVSTFGEAVKRTEKCSRTEHLSALTSSN